MKYRTRAADSPAAVDAAVEVVSTPELRAYRKRCIEDYGFFALNELKIDDVNSEEVPLKFNMPQARFAGAIAKRQARQAPVLFVVAKSRQWGCSTEISGWIVKQLVQRPGTKALVIVHHEDALPAFRRTYRKMLSLLSPAWRVGILVDGEDGFVLDNGGIVDFRTAGTKTTASGTGRSQTYQILHASEVPFWMAPIETFRAAKACIHLKGKHARDVHNKAIFLESSPRGRDPVFHDQYDKAKRGHSDYEAFFVPWHEIEWYSVDVTQEQTVLYDSYKKGGSASLLVKAGWREDAENRIGRFNLKVGQWAWWNYTLENGSPLGDIEKMRSEYPDDDISCFTGTDGTIFADKYLYKHIGNQRPGEEGQIVAGKWVPERFGKFRMWHPPVRGCIYFACSDVASGNSGSRDWTVFKIFERVPGGGIIECAKLRNQFTPEESADLALDLCALYFDPLVAIEVNNGYGAAKQSYMRRRGYANFYRRQVQEKIIGPGGVITDDLGWWTTAKTKSHMVSAARSYLHRAHIRFHDPDLFSEIATFVRDPRNSKEGAASGKNDDEVIVMCIACYIDQELAPVPVTPRNVADPNRPLQDDGTAIPVWRLDTGLDVVKPKNPLSYLGYDTTWRMVR
jgi:hypothetical protein